MTDPINGAIQAAQQVEMATVKLRFPTGRPMTISVPRDLTPFEGICAVRAVIDVFDQLQARKGPQLVIPNGVLPKMGN